MTPKISEDDLKRLADLNDWLMSLQPHNLALQDYFSSMIDKLSSR